MIVVWLESNSSSKKNNGTVVHLCTLHTISEVFPSVLYVSVKKYTKSNISSTI